MYQTEEIHECFYDLFNLRFRSIKVKGSADSRYYANVAIGGHIRPVRVNPEFKCIIVLKKSKMEETPAPFLNRFEKYQLSHELILDAVLHSYRGSIRHIVNKAFIKVHIIASLKFTVRCHSW